MSRAALLPATAPASLGRRVLQAFLHAAAVALALGCAAVAPPAQASADPFSGGVPTAGDDAPPGRVGKIGLVSGPVVHTDLRTGEMLAAVLNWPITSGNRLSTSATGRVEVRIGSLAIRLDGDTEVDFSRVDDEVIQIALQRGSVALRARNREILPEIDFVTPRDRITLDDVGRYRIDVDRTEGLTAVTAWVGAARVTTAAATFVVRSSQRVEVGGVPPRFVVVAPAADTFDDWVARRDRRDDALVSTRFVSPETTGVEVLDHHGTWRVVPRYGTVWFPAAVPVGWVPFRHGRWAHIAPWGWTWIDDMPWGFAPFHYGRWALVGGVWGWVPGAWVARPVFAPALVGWFAAPGVGVSVTIGSVGWFPLAPFEVYVPPYHFNRRHITLLNIGHVRDFDYRRVGRPPVFTHQRPHAATWVPNDAVLRSEPIKRFVHTPPDEARHFVGRHLPPAELRGERKRAPAQAEPRLGAPAPAEELVRPMPHRGRAEPAPDREDRERVPRERKFDADRPPMAAPPTRPVPVAPLVAPGRKPEFVTRPQPPIAAPVAPAPREFEPAPLRKPAPALTVPPPPPATPAPRGEPMPRFERVAPPTRAIAPDVAAPPARGQQPDFVVRPPARPKAEAAPPARPQIESPRIDGPRGGKHQREQ
jgi:hypothetical protein